MKNILLLFLCSLSVLSCSRLDTAFNWADTYIASQVDDYFDISFKQSSALKKSIRQDLNIVKAQYLPGLIKDVKTVKADVLSNKLDQKEIKVFFSSFFKKINYIESFFSKSATEFLGGLSQKQLDYFTKAFAKKSDEEKEKANSGKKVQDLIKTYNKYFEMFLGNLSDEQKILIENNVRQNPFPSDLRIKNKEWVCKQFLQKRSSVPELQNFAKEYLSKPEKYKLPEYDTALKVYYGNLQNFLADFSRTVTKQQKETLLKNIDEKINQLEKIKNEA
ncbi:MAG: DUF6279 family lipoprotein [Bdellovibrio sp.]